MQCSGESIYPNVIFVPHLENDVPLDELLHNAGHLVFPEGGEEVMKVFKGAAGNELDGLENAFCKGISLDKSLQVRVSAVHRNQVATIARSDTSNRVLQTANNCC